MPHSASRRTIPQHTALVQPHMVHWTLNKKFKFKFKLHLCHSCCGRFHTKEVGQGTQLHKIIHLSAATVDSVWHLRSKIFYFMDFIPHIMRGLSVEILWKFHGQSRSGVNCRVQFQSRRGHDAYGYSMTHIVCRRLPCKLMLPIHSMIAIVLE
jgi:hypothetical protein